MTESQPPAADNREGLVRVLRAVAVQAALLSAAAHLLWAWPLLGTSDPRPYVFITAAVFLALIGAAVIHASREYRRLYALGAGTLGALLVGYVGWYGSGAVETFAGDPLVLVAKAAEAVGLVAFAGLYRLAPPTSVVVERRRAGAHEPGGRETEASDGGDRAAEAGTDPGEREK